MSKPTTPRLTSIPLLPAGKYKKKPPKVIDPNDGLHEAIDRVLAGLSPSERTKRLLEMFPDKDEGDEYPTDYDLAEQAVKEMNKSRESNSPEQPTQPEKSADGGVWYTDKQGVRRKSTEAELEMARKLGYL